MWVKEIKKVNCMYHPSDYCNASNASHSLYPHHVLYYLNHIHNNMSCTKQLTNCKKYDGCNGTYLISPFQTQCILRFEGIFLLPLGTYFLLGFGKVECWWKVRHGCCQLCRTLWKCEEVVNFAHCKFQVDGLCGDGQTEYLRKGGDPQHPARQMIWFSDRIFLEHNHN